MTSKKLTTLATLALGAISVLGFTATAHADEPAPCADGYVASGPYCVNPIYLDATRFADPATCQFGYYQGACVPDTLPDPVVLEPAAYTFQTPTTPATIGMVRPVMGWLSTVDLLLAFTNSPR